MYGQYNCLPHRVLQGLICLFQLEIIESEDQNPGCLMQIMLLCPRDSSLPNVTIQVVTYHGEANAFKTCRSVLSPSNAGVLPFLLRI